MPSLLLVTLVTIACALLPQCASAQNQSRSMQRQARNQIAYKTPSAGQFVGSQYNFDYSAFADAQIANQLQIVNQAQISNQAQFANQPASDTWTPQQSGVASAYNYSDLSGNQAGALNSVARSYARPPATYAMSQADILAARRAVLSGSFFTYHGTQSSQISRNR